MATLDISFKPERAHLRKPKSGVITERIVPQSVSGRYRRLKWAALAGAMDVGLSMRGDAKTIVIHDRNPVAVRLSDSRIRNGYTVRLYNKADGERDFRLEVTGLPEASVEVIGDDATVSVDPDSTRELRVLVSASVDDRRANAFTATDVASGAAVTAQDRFIPVEGGR